MSCCSIDIEEPRATVTLAPRQTVEHAGELQERLLELELGATCSIVELDTRQISEIDITFLQLLQALCISLDAAGASLRCTNDELAEPVCRAIERTGFFRLLPEKERGSNAALLHRLVYRRGAHHE